jgi:hypothetical protein
MALPKAGEKKVSDATRLAAATQFALDTLHIAPVVGPTTRETYWVWLWGRCTSTGQPMRQAPWDKSYELVPLPQLLRILLPLIVDAAPKPPGKQPRASNNALRNMLDRYHVREEMVTIGPNKWHVDPRALLMLVKTGVMKRPAPTGATAKANEEEEEEEANEDERPADEGEEGPGSDPAEEEEQIPLDLDEIPADGMDIVLDQGDVTAHAPAWLSALIQKGAGLVHYMGSTRREQEQFHTPPAEMQRYFAGITPVTVKDSLAPVLGEVGLFLDDSPFLNAEQCTRTAMCLDKGLSLGLAHHRLVEDAIVARRSPTFLFDLAYTRELQRRDIVPAAVGMHAALYQLLGSPQVPRLPLPVSHAWGSGSRTRNASAAGPYCQCVVRRSRDTFGQGVLELARRRQASTQTRDGHGSRGSPTPPTTWITHGRVSVNTSSSGSLSTHSAWVHR